MRIVDPRLVVLSRHVRRAAGYGPDAYRRYLESDTFKKDFEAVAPSKRRQAIEIINAVDPTAPPPPPKRASGKDKGKWLDPARQARLRAAYARAGAAQGLTPAVHERAAIILGISKGSARLAHKRYILNAATPGSHQAA